MERSIKLLVASETDGFLDLSENMTIYMDRDDNRVESHRSFKCDRYSASHSYRHEQDLRPTQAIECVQQSMLVTASVDAAVLEGCSALSLDEGEVKVTKKCKHKSRWDQPAETNSSSGVVSYVDERQNIPDDIPPGFSCPLGSLNASSLNLGDLALQNVGNSGCPSDAVIGHPKEKFNSRLPVSYGMSRSVASNMEHHMLKLQRIGSLHLACPSTHFLHYRHIHGMRRTVKCQPSNTTNAMTIDEPAEVGQRNTSGLINCYLYYRIPTGANPEDMDLSYKDTKHISKQLKGYTCDLGRRYFRQQKWNNSKIP